MRYEIIERGCVADTVLSPSNPAEEYVVYDRQRQQVVASLGTDDEVAARAEARRRGYEV